MEQTALFANVDWTMVGAIATVGTVVPAFPGFLVALFGIRKRLARIEEQNEAGAAALEKLAKVRQISDGDQNSLWSR